MRVSRIYRLLRLTQMLQSGRDYAAVGYGDQVKVVAPAKLRWRVAEMARSMAGRYERRVDSCER